jgi:hypothetical protein
MEHEINAFCRERFDKIDARLEKGDNEFRDHGEKIVEIKTDVSHLTKSLEGVTKALWGVAGAIMATLFGFLLWFIQTK